MGILLAEKRILLDILIVISSYEHASTFRSFQSYGAAMTVRND